MQIHDITLQEELGIFCKTSKELYFNVEDENYDHSKFQSLAATWVDEVMDEPEIKDAALKLEWEAYCSQHELEIEEDEISFERVRDFLSGLERPDLQALFCCYDMGIASSCCILVVNEDFEIRDLSSNEPI